MKMKHLKKFIMILGDIALCDLKVINLLILET